MKSLFILVLSVFLPLYASSVYVGIAAAQDITARYHCRHLSLIDKETGQEIVGAEDVALYKSGNAVFISAYDRWAVEDAVNAVSEDAAGIPKGGIYLLHLQDLLQSAQAGQAGQDRVYARDVTYFFKENNDFRPHGIDFYEGAAGKYLFAVNRKYNVKNRVFTPVIEIFNITGEVLSHNQTIDGEVICNANDVAAVDENHFFVTNDRGRCSSAGKWLENIFGLKNANVVEFKNRESRIVVEDIGFANGVTVDTKKEFLYLAATREKALYMYPYTSEVAKGGKLNINKLAKIGLKDAPDNLNITDEGDLLIAMHPSLLQLGFYLKRWFGVDNAASKLVKLNVPQYQFEQEIFHDPKGEEFAAATSAVKLRDFYIIGSVLDAGVMVCTENQIRN